jgi:hypothetical protein
VYDLDGHASQLSIGALLETIAIAASGHGLRPEIHRRRTDLPETRPTFDIRFVGAAPVAADPLIAAILARQVHRRAMESRRLRLDEKESLERALGRGYRIVCSRG